MTTTPNGTPAWTRAADHTYYGGHADKANYNGEPIVNPRTDVDASQIQRLASDMASVARMANFCEIDFVATGGNPTVTQCRMMTGILTSSYAGTSPPTGFPTVQQPSSGVYTIEIGGSYTDDYSVAAVFQPIFAGGYCTNQAAYVKAYTSGTTTVYVEAQNGAGTGISAGAFHVWIA